MKHNDLKGHIFLAMSQPQPMIIELGYVPKKYKDHAELMDEIKEQFGDNLIEYKGFINIKIKADNDN